MWLNSRTQLSGPICARRRQHRAALFSHGERGERRPPDGHTNVKPVQKGIVGGGDRGGATEGERTKLDDSAAAHTTIEEVGLAKQDLLSE
jgi:hypothetical protein